MKIYTASWVLPISSPPLQDGALAIDDEKIVAVSFREDAIKRFPEAEICNLGEAAIIPGLVNCHSHLELTTMRGFLDDVEGDFFSWLKKLTQARLERLTADDLYVSCAWGACEAVRAGVTCVADSSDSAISSMKAIRDVGLRGIVFQESFGPDPKLAGENFSKLQEKVATLKELESRRLRVGVSPHAPYTVCAAQLEMVAAYAIDQKLPLMMHAAESVAETELLQNGSGVFAQALKTRSINWRAPKKSTIRYLADCGILETSPLLAHCVHVDSADVALIQEKRATIAHCPRSNAKLGHGLAPLSKFLKEGVKIGLGSDSVASNNSCDILTEAQFAILVSRIMGAVSSDSQLAASDALALATRAGAEALGLGQYVGALEAGLQADFTALSISGVHQQPAFDPLTTLIFSSSARDVILTVVAGKEVFADNEVKYVDEEYLRQRMREITRQLSS